MALSGQTGPPSALSKQRTLTLVNVRGRDAVGMLRALTCEALSEWERPPLRGECCCRHRGQRGAQVRRAGAAMRHFSKNSDVGQVPHR